MIEAKYDSSNGWWVLKHGRGQPLGYIVPKRWIYHLVLPNNQPHPVSPAENREVAIQSAIDYLNK